MSKRVRLTDPRRGRAASRRRKRNADSRSRRGSRRRRAVEGPPYTPYSGTVNQPDRQFKSHGEYDNWEEVVNHPLPDMRTEWRDDRRDEIGFGVEDDRVPTGSRRRKSTHRRKSARRRKGAEVQADASRAVRLAVLMLGEKVGERDLERQARDFLRMGSRALEASLRRFADTHKLYAGDDEGDEGDEGDKTAAAGEAPEGDKTASSESDSAGDQGGERMAAAELDIELTASQGELPPDPEAEKLLGSILVAGEDEDADDSEDEDDDEDADEADEEESEEEEEEADKSASRERKVETAKRERAAKRRRAGSRSKKGAASVGAQPRVRAREGAALDNLENLWDSPPDVTAVFK